MTNVQPNPSAPITQGDFSRFLDMLQSTKEALEAQRRDNLRMRENMITMGRELQELRRQRTPSPPRRIPTDDSSSSEEERPRERRPLERPQNLDQLTFGSLGYREDVARVLGPDDPSLQQPMLLPMRGSHVLSRDPNITNPIQQQLLQPLPPEIDREHREQRRAATARNRRLSPDQEPRGNPNIRSREPV